LTSDEIPSQRHARVVLERRETNEARPARPRPGTPQVIGRARTERWYELHWEPRLGLWVRSADALKIEGRIPALCRVLPPLVEESFRASDERVRALRDIGLKREQLFRSVKQNDDGTGSDEATTQAAQEFEASQQVLRAAEAHRARVREKLNEKVAEIEAHFVAADMARRG
jgi:hypothetical protein